MRLSFVRKYGSSNTQHWGKTEIRYDLWNTFIIFLFRYLVQFTIFFSAIFLIKLTPDDCCWPNAQHCCDRRQMNVMVGSNLWTCRIDCIPCWGRKTNRDRIYINKCGLRKVWLIGKKNELKKMKKKQYCAFLCEINTRQAKRFSCM